MISKGILADVAVFPNGTPNGAPVPLTSVAVDSWRVVFLDILDMCDTNSITPIAWTVLPEANGSSDYLRTNYNKELQAQYKGIAQADFSNAIKSETLDVNGGEVLNPAYAYDTVHPNNTGYDVLGVTLMPVMAKIARIGENT